MYWYSLITLVQICYFRSDNEYEMLCNWYLRILLVQIRVMEVIMSWRIDKWVQRNILISQL
jgi:hypothetical protein